MQIYSKKEQRIQQVAKALRSNLKKRKKFQNKNNINKNKEKK
jgi:hypothetical protein|tara:strand:+ start:4586 stop:4711 length:126 start_codon:yes stop_codon:yes gene_type:complete